MSLADYKPARESVEFKGGSVSVRGLSLDDMTVLMRNHLADLDRLMEIYRRDVRDELAVAAAIQYGVSLAREAPGLVAHVIALASDEPDHVDQARMLPLPVQVEILKSVGRMTFEEVGGAKKFLEGLDSLFRQIRPAKTPDSPT